MNVSQREGPLDAASEMPSVALVLKSVVYAWALGADVGSVGLVRAGMAGGPLVPPRTSHLTAPPADLERLDAVP